MVDAAPCWQLEDDGRMQFLVVNLRDQGRQISEIAATLGISKRQVRKLTSRVWGERLAPVIGGREGNHRARAREYGVECEAVDLVAVYQRDKGICHICEQPVADDELHFDHVVALVNGGAHRATNVAVAHARCNLTKGSQ